MNKYKLIVNQGLILIDLEAKTNENDILHSNNDTSLRTTIKLKFGRCYNNNDIEDKEDSYLPEEECYYKVIATSGFIKELPTIITPEFEVREMFKNKKDLLNKLTKLAPNYNNSQSYQDGFHDAVYLIIDLLKKERLANPVTHTKEQVEKAIELARETTNQENWVHDEIHFYKVSKYTTEQILHQLEPQIEVDVDIEQIPIQEVQIGEYKNNEPEFRYKITKII